MGEVERHELAWWGEKIVGDPELMPVDAKGKRPGDQGYGTEPLTTFCNLGVHRICRGMKYDEFADMTANEIYDYCVKKWVVPYGTDSERASAAQVAANIGDLALAAQKGERHGHVAVVAPGSKVYSGRWGFYVPRCFNVGKRNGLMGVNYAFKTIPDFFILGRTVT